MVLLFATRAVVIETAAASSHSAHAIVEVAKPAAALRPACWKERVVIAVFLGALGMWATDTFHGIRPVTVALVAVLIMFFPGLGPVDFGVLRGKLNFGVLIFVAATMTLGPLLKNADTVADFVRKGARKVVASGDGPLSRYLLLFVLAMPLDLLVNGAT